MPPISCVIRVHNTEKHLRFCLDSVLCQTMNDYDD